MRMPGVSVLMRGIFALVMLAAASVAGAASPPARLHALVEAYWQWSLVQYPERATYLGEHRYDDLLSDASPAASERRFAELRRFRRSLMAIAPAKLAPEDTVTYRLLGRDLDLQIEGHGFSTDVLAMSAMSGPHTELPQLFSVMPVDTAQARARYVARLRAIPAYLEQVEAQLREGVKKGIVAHRASFETVPGLLDALADPRVAQARFAARLGESPGAGSDVFAGQASRVVADEVVPALARLSRFVCDTYLPAARPSPSIATLPGGDARYRFAVRVHTATQMTPAEIHALGLAEVGRIRGEMMSIARELGHDSVASLFAAVAADPRRYFTDEDEMLAAYRATAKRVDAQTPRLFAQLPRAPYGVEAVPRESAAAQSGGYYVPGAADGSRAGIFFVNTHEPRTRPRHTMVALTLHEAAPGHHLQIARALELRGLPAYRKNYWSTAYGEGWALYAEGLGEDIGLYDNAYARLGRLEMEIWRAARLVIDTGLHSAGWTRRQAIDYLVAQGTGSEQEARVEVDRYIDWPGQALAYKVGELRIRALRERAARALGDRFDLRRFHNVVLDSGTLPLDVLETQVDAWIACTRSSRTSAASGARHLPARVAASAPPCG